MLEISYVLILQDLVRISTPNSQQCQLLVQGICEINTNSKTGILHPSHTPSVYWGIFEKSLNFNAAQHGDTYRNREEMCGHGATGELPVAEEALLLRSRSLLKKLVFLVVAAADVTFETGTPAGLGVELATCDRLLWLVEARPGRD